MDDNESDQAYVQYLRASEITVNTIPHHPEYRTTITQRPGWYKDFAGLMMVRSLFRIILVQSAAALRFLCEVLKGLTHSFAI